METNPGEPSREALCAKCGEPASRHGDFGFRDHAPRDDNGDEIFTVSTDEATLRSELQAANEEVGTLKLSLASKSELATELDQQLQAARSDSVRLKAALDEAKRLLKKVKPLLPVRPTSTAIAKVSFCDDIVVEIEALLGEWAP